MKLKKLLMCLLVATLTASVPAISAEAAETDSIVSVTEDATEETITDSLLEEVLAEEAETEDTEEVITEEAEEEVKETKAAEKKKAKKAVKKASYTKEELRLLASLISCEAGGEPYAGKVAVGIVVVNRKNSSRFPNSVKSVIYQKYQFGPARNGSLARALQRYDNGKFTSSNDKECIKAAKAALEGTKKVNYKGKTLNLNGFLFFSGRVSGAKLQIANHQFK